MTDTRKKITEDVVLINTLLLAFLVMALALQLLVVVVWIFSFIPIKPSPLISTLFYRHLPQVFLKRDLSFYHFFLATAIFLQAGGMLILKQHFSKRSFTSQLWRFTLVEYGWVFLIVFTVFKMFVYGFAPWTKVFFYTSLIASVLSKIFWKEIVSLHAQATQYWVKHKGDPKIHRYCDLIFVLVIFLVVYIPDNQGLLAKMFMTDHFYHFDNMIMSPAWAYLKGAVLDVDQFTHYSIGLAAVFGRLGELFGGFDYPTVVKILCMGTVIYYIGVYALIRFWLKSIVISMAMVLLLIKWQMFNPGVATIIFNYPSASVWRYPMDIVFLYLLLLHLRRNDVRFLAASAVIAGFSAFYMIDTGIYMSVAFAFYMLCGLVMDIQDGPAKEARSKVLKAAGILLIAPLTALGCLLLTQGHYLFTKFFWENLSERTALFVMGHDDLPMYKSLVEGKYLESWMGFFIPWFYTLFLIAASTLLFLRKISRENLFIITVTFYGLGLYHYYVVRSADTSYYVVILPFVFILGFMLNWLVASTDRFRRPLLGSVLALSFFSLFTNQYFLSYPNFLQLSRNPITRPFVQMKLDDGLSFFDHNDMVVSPAIKLSANSLGESNEDLRTEKDFKDDQELKDYFAREFDFSQDAALIDRLTAQGQKVPLISSFETKIFIQANRRPFFYYFPFIDSRPMHMRMFPFTSLWTTGRVKKTLDQLEVEKPEYIFMEKILLAQSVPASYQYLDQDMLIILNYIDQHYQPEAQGRWLVAMKRKNSI